MKIKVFIPAALFQMEDEIKIYINVKVESIEGCIVPIDQHIEEMTEFQKIVIETFREIFLEDGLNFRDIDGDERWYTHPGKIAELINRGNKYPYAVSGINVGRLLQKLGIKSGERKSSGIPYFWDENQENVERLLSQFKDLEV